MSTGLISEFPDNIHLSGKFHNLLFVEKSVYVNNKMKRGSGRGLRSGFSYGTDKPCKSVTTITTTTTTITITTTTTTTTSWCMELPNPEQQTNGTRQTRHFVRMNTHNPLNSTV
jgi:hypothetical protein